MKTLVSKSTVTFYGSKMCGIPRREVQSTVENENGTIVFSASNFIYSENPIGFFNTELTVRKDSAAAEFLKNNKRPDKFIIRNVMEYRTTNMEFTKFKVKWPSGNVATVYSQLNGEGRTFIRRSNM
tara:strand:+ start:3563 stop:3940 length:378 start_codon:yes stop_codon:yes gene_type:complete